MKYLAGLLTLVLCVSAQADSFVEFSTNMGSFYVQLYDSKPITTTNFLKYATDGDYTSTFVHRSARLQDGSPFVIQGGGFGWNDTDGGWSVPTDPPIQNEPGISNLRGTIAMAKTSDPNSATSQWFFNLANNSFLDSPANGAFTVFGRVIGNGMNVVDAIAGLTVYDGSSIYSAFGELPLKGPYFDAEHLVMINSVSVVQGMPGDANRDGYVDDNDLGILLGNWSGTGTPARNWAGGDFNGNSSVDDNDLGIPLGNWTGSATGVPEPVTLAILALGAVALARRSRR